MQACVDAGGADGITRRREPTVDGLSLDLHAAAVSLLGYHWTIPRRPATRPVRTWPLRVQDGRIEIALSGT